MNLGDINHRIRKRFPHQPEVPAVCLCLLMAFRNGERKLPVWIKIRKFLQDEPDLLQQVEDFLDAENRPSEPPLSLRRSSERVTILVSDVDSPLAPNSSMTKTGGGHSEFDQMTLPKL